MFNNVREYTCECGHIFDNSQKFNGHKAQCKVHRKIKYGGQEEEFTKNYKNNLSKSLQKSEKFKLYNTQRVINSQVKQQEFLNNWINEQHYCEHCGKLMTEYYGSGRFCSRACANSRIHTIESRKKTSNSLRKRHNDKNNLPFCPALIDILDILKQNKANKKSLYKSKEKELENIIPIVIDEVENRKQGWQSRSIKYSYPEQFWKTVFENNNVNYLHSIRIHNEKTGIGAASYEIDFLINDIYDIEIDGGQHLEEDICTKDIRRDAYLTSLGYVIYRIPWINPIGLENKLKVKQQIIDLFNFLNIELLTK